MTFWLQSRLYQAEERFKETEEKPESIPAVSSAQHLFLNHVSMKINRAVGFACFLLFLQLAFAEVVHQISQTLVAILDTIETLAEVASIEMHKSP